MPSASSRDPGRARVIIRHIPYGPELLEGIGLAAPITEVAVGAQRFLLSPGRSRVITCQAPYDPEIGQRVGLAKRVTEVAVDAQRLLQGLRAAAR